MAKLHVRGHLPSIFEKLVKRYESDPKVKIKAVIDGAIEQTSQSDGKPQYHFVLDDLKGYLSDATPIKPQRLMKELSDIFPPNTHYLADTGTSFAWATHYLHPYDRRMAGKRNANGGVFRAALDFASMGWAIGSAIGTALVQKGSPVVCITGDGSILMNGQEITVAVQEELPVVFVILNDSGYGMVKHGQRMTGAEEVGVDMPKTDFASFAQAMGAEGYVIHSPGDLLALDVQQICNRKGPTVLDVRIDKDEVPPIGVRTSVLTS